MLKSPVGPSPSNSLICYDLKQDQVFSFIQLAECWLEKTPCAVSLYFH